MNKDELSANEAKRLLELEKTIDFENSDKTRLSSEDLFVRKRFSLVSTKAIKEERFRLLIHRSTKKITKISLVHLYDGLFKCLFRLDLSGTHKNPEIANDNVPHNFAIHAGEILWGSHVHYYIEGEDDRWALPIEETEFKDFAKVADLEEVLQDIIDKVSEHIHLNTRIIYDKSIPYDGTDE